MNFLKEYRAATKQPKGIAIMRFIVLSLVGISLAILYLGDIFKNLTDPNFTVFNLRAVEGAVVVSAAMAFLYKQVEKLGVLSLWLALLASSMSAGYLVIREVSLFKKIYQLLSDFEYESRT